jgi:hypothetical protein
MRRQLDAYEPVSIGLFVTLRRHSCIAANYPSFYHFARRGRALALEAIDQPPARHGAHLTFLPKRVELLLADAPGRERSCALTVISSSDFAP